MTDQKKTKAELISELVRLRETVAELKKSEAQLKQAEKELPESKAKYRDLLDNLPAITYIGTLDSNSITLYISPQIKNILGVSVSDFKADPDLWDKMLHPEDRERVIAEVSHYHSKREPYALEYRMITKDGDEIYVYDNAWVVEDDNGKPLYRQSMIYDITNHKRAEKARWESEQKYRLLFETAKDAIFTTDENGKFIDVNQAASELLGYSKEEFMELTIEDVDPEGYERLIKALDSHVKNSMFEANLRRKDGTVFSAEVNGTVFVSSGQAMSLAIVRDISGRKQAEKTLRESEAKYRALVDNLPAITYLAALDSNSTTLYISPQVKNILGVSASDFEADPDLWIKMLHPEDRERVVAEVSHYHSKRKPFTVEYRMIAKDGHDVYIYDDAWIVEDENGKPLYSQGVMHDITSRKQAEKAQRESEQKYRLLFETAKDAIFINDEKGNFIDVNQTACDSLGYSKEEFMELTIKNIDAGPEGYEQFTKLRNGRAKSATFKVNQRRKDGTLLPVEISGAFFVSHGQRMSLAIARDISERKQTEKKIKVYQEQLQSLASEISSTEERQRRQFATDLHDNIGQLLAVINIKLGSARKAAPPGEMAKLLDEINELIVKAFHCTQSLTHELYPPILYKLGLEPAVEWLLENLKKEHGIAYRFETKGETKQLDNDISSLLYRAVRELLINVTKHAKADEVQVSIQKWSKQIKISVEDNGGGFDTSQLKPVSKQAKGFGLFSVRERLSYQGGKLDIESVIGRGTRVTITAPLTMTH